MGPSGALAIVAAPGLNTLARIEASLGRTAASSMCRKSRCEREAPDRPAGRTRNLGRDLDELQRHPVALSDGRVLGAVARVGVGRPVGTHKERRRKRPHPIWIVFRILRVGTLNLRLPREREARSLDLRDEPCLRDVSRLATARRICTGRGAVLLVPQDAVRRGLDGSRGKPRVLSVPQFCIMWTSRIQRTRSTCPSRLQLRLLVVHPDHADLTVEFRRRAK